MPRYIDVDHVNEQLKKWKRGCEEDNSEEAADSFQDCIHLIRDTHTADVVPRAEYEKVKAENEELKRRLERVIKDNCEDICKHCKNQIECKSKECEAYVSGVGDIDGKYPTMKWSCEDFDFGTCPMMEKTPCNGCVDNDYCGFKLRDAQGED